MTTKSPPSFLGELWEEFTAIDLTGYTNNLKHANNATYLSWSNAWTILMQRYPRSVENFEVITLDNKSVEIRCTLIIADDSRTAERTMFLPVMDGKNQAIIDPTTRAISDAKQRCFVKTLAKFGLGIHLYSGDEFPKLEHAPNILTGNIEKRDIDDLLDLLTKSESDVDAFNKFFKIENLSELPKTKLIQATALLESKIKKQEASK